MPNEPNDGDPKIAFTALPLPPFMKYHNEIERRKTFAIISHPDAGKTTLTEKFLLFGGAIQVAGAVKSNKIKKHATSDFMEIERQRGYMGGYLGEVK